MPNTDAGASDRDADRRSATSTSSTARAQALKNVNLDVPANAVTAIIGPSGCGKSTLLRAINRIYELYPDQRAEGEIVIDGSNVLDRRYPLVRPAPERRHGVPEADAVRVVDPQQCRLRALLLREAVEGRDSPTGSRTRFARRRCGTRSRTS